MAGPAARSRRRLRFAILTLALAAAPPLVATPPDEIDLGQIVTGQPPGVRQTERLAKKAEALIDRLAAAQEQVRATLGAYDALLFGGAVDLRKPYRRLDKELGRCDDRREAVRRAASEAKAESTDYFRAWAGSLPLIEDEELRQRSEARLRDSRARLDGVVQAGVSATAAYEPFLARLHDQWNYLGHDLNPGAIESLRPDAQTTGADGRVLLAEIDETLRQSREYVASIRARRSPPPPAPPAPSDPPSAAPASPAAPAGPGR